MESQGAEETRVPRGKKEKVYLFECLRWCQRLVSLNDCPIFQGLIVDTYKAYPWLSLCIFNAHGRNGLVLRTRVENYLPPPPSIKIPDSCILEGTKRPAHDSNLFTNHGATSLSSFLSFHPLERLSSNITKLNNKEHFEKMDKN